MKHNGKYSYSPNKWLQRTIDSAVRLAMPSHTTLSIAAEPKRYVAKEILDETF